MWENWVVTSWKERADTRQMTAFGMRLGTITRSGLDSTFPSQRADIHLGKFAQANLGHGVGRECAGECWLG